MRSSPSQWGWSRRERLPVPRNRSPQCPAQSGVARTPARLAGRLRAQNGICAERIGIRRISTVPVSPAIHGHGCGRRVVHVVRIEFGDAVGPTVVAEQGIIVDERHGSDAPLPQRLGRVCRKRSQPGTPIDVRQIDSPTPSSMSPLPLSTNREVPSSRCSK